MSNGAPAAACAMARKNLSDLVGGGAGLPVFLAGGWAEALRRALLLPPSAPARTVATGWLVPVPRTLAGPATPSAHTDVRKPDAGRPAWNVAVRACGGLASFKLACNPAV